MIDRTVEDGNFAHTVSLLGFVGAWAESLPDDHQLGWNDVNMIHLGVEVALAFMKVHADEQSPLGLACRQALDNLALARSMAAERALPPGDTSNG